MSVTSTLKTSFPWCVRTLATISSPLVCLGGSTRLNSFWATTMMLPHPHNTSCPMVGSLCLGTISSPLGSLHSAWIWQVHRPKISGAASMSVTLPHRLNTSYQGSIRDYMFLLLRTALGTTPRDHQPPTTNRCRPPLATNRQPPTAINRQPPNTPNTINHQSPTTNRHHPLPTATNRRSPTANTWCACARGLFWKSCVMQHFFPPIKDHSAFIPWWVPMLGNDFKYAHAFW